MQSEASIVASIMRAAKKCGWWIMKIHGGPFQLAGIPDLLCVKRGRAVFLEVKQPGKHPTPIQARRMHEITVVGGARCAVVTSKEEALNALLDQKDGEGRDAEDKAYLRAERRTAVPRNA